MSVITVTRCHINDQRWNRWCEEKALSCTVSYSGLFYFAARRKSNPGVTTERLKFHLKHKRRKSQKVINVFPQKQNLAAKTFKRPGMNLGNNVLDKENPRNHSSDTLREHDRSHNDCLAGAVIYVCYIRLYGGQDKFSAAYFLQVWFPVGAYERSLKWRGQQLAKLVTFYV